MSARVDVSDDVMDGHKKLYFQLYYSEVLFKMCEGH